MFVVGGKGGIQFDTALHSAKTFQQLKAQATWIIVVADFFFQFSIISTIKLETCMYEDSL